jgi:hypothetical protein
VCESYAAVRDKDSAEVFWCSRLEFATEVVVISNLFATEVVEISNLIKNMFLFRYCGAFMTRNIDRQPNANEEQPDTNTTEKNLDSLCSSLWCSVTKVLKDQRDLYETWKGREFSSNCLSHLIHRVFVMLFILIWVLLGAVTFGLLWPPQIRHWLWKSSTDDDSQKKIIQDEKNILTFEGNNTPLEGRLKFMEEEIGYLKCKNDQLIKGMEDIKGIMEAIKQLIEEM